MKTRIVEKRDSLPSGEKTEMHEPCIHADVCGSLRSFLQQGLTHPDGEQPIRICSDDLRFYTHISPDKLEKCPRWKKIRSDFGRAGVTWEAPCLGPSGYAFAARGYIAGLQKIGAFLRVQPIYDVKVNVIGSNSSIPEGWRAYLGVIEGTAARLSIKSAVDDMTLSRIFRSSFVPSRGVYVCHHVPVSPDEKHDFYAYFRRRNPGMCAYVGYTTFETDSIPPSWVASCNKMDEIWVPSHFNLETFTAAGVNRDKIHVIPHGFDPDRYLPSKTVPLSVGEPKGFTFLSIFEWTYRKGWDVLIRAYIEEFDPHEDVRLLIRSYQGGGVIGDETLPIAAQFEQFVTSLGRTISNIPSVQFIDRMIPDAEMPSLYRASDAFVLPTRGEGWGIPLTEAMLMEIPTIATRWSGHLEFMNDDNSFLIDIDGLEAVSERQVEDNPFYSGHSWARPSVAHLRRLLREVFEDRQLAQKKAKLGRETIISRFSEQRVALKIVERIRALSGCQEFCDRVSVDQQRSKRSILIQCSPENLLMGGVAQRLLEALKELLRKEGYIVDHCSHELSLAPYELVVFIGIDALLAGNVVAHAKPYIVIPLIDYSDPFQPYIMGNLSKIRSKLPLNETPPNSGALIRVNQEFRFVISNAELVLVPSNYDRDVITALIPEAEIEIIDTREFFSFDSEPLMVKQKSGQFVLCPGDLRPKQQQMLLLNAMGAALFPMVLLYENSEEMYEQLLLEHADDQKVLLMKVTRDEEFTNFYENARIILLTGWMNGWEIAEELAKVTLSNAPLLAPDTPLYHHILGDRAIYYDPFDFQGLVSMLKNLWDQKTVPKYSRISQIEITSCVKCIESIIDSQSPRHNVSTRRLSAQAEFEQLMSRYRYLAQASKGMPESLSEISQLAEEMPDDPIIRYHKGELHFFLQQDQLAEKELLAAMQINPCFSLRAYVLLSAIYICRNDGLKALNIIKKGREMFPFIADEMSAQLNEAEKRACQLIKNP